MFRNFAALACLLVAQTSGAVDFGFGASLKSDESTIYVPVHVGKHFMIEPFFRYRDRDSQNTASTTSVKNMTLGAGLFAVLRPVEKASVYLGARVAYVEEEQKYTFTVLNFSNPGSGFPGFGFLPNPGSGFVANIESKTKQDGYLIAPTLGFEYWIIEQLSVGAEVAWEYVSLDGSTTRSGVVPSSRPADSKSTGTRTNIILRFYF